MLGRARPVIGIATPVIGIATLVVFAAGLSGQAAAARPFNLLPSGSERMSGVSPPRNASPPIVSGTTSIGQQLRSTTGVWSGTQPISYAYQWLLCDPAGATCVAITGVSSAIYVLVSSDVGHTLRSQVTASNPGGSVMAQSAQTAVVELTPSASSFVQRSGRSLVLSGARYTFTGVNDYGANQTCGPAIGLDSSLTDWGGGGGSDPRVLRAWFFQDMATTRGQRDWSRFDNTLAIAAKHGYRVIVTLANQWADCDSGYGYKTANWYQSGYKMIDPAGTESYRDYVRDIVTRYTDDPTILMWQLINEAEVKTGSSGACAPNAESILQAWAGDVSGLIKSIDSNHLVSIGTIGSGQCGASGTDYQTLHAIPTVDLCEYHDYGWPSTPMPGDKWNGLATRISQCAADGKPLFVGESGISSTDDGGNLQARANWFKAKLSAQFAAGVVGEVVWGWETSDGFGLWPGDPTLFVLAGY